MLVTRRTALTCLVIALLLVLIACGGGDSSEQAAVRTESKHDGVFTIQADGERQELPAPDEIFLQAGEGVDVDDRGRAILTFADLLKVEVLRAGALTLEELPVEEQSPFITVLQNGGTLVNEFNPKEEIARRFTVETEFAKITATGTRFIVAREAGSPLEWVLAKEAKGDDLVVTSKATDESRPVEAGTARWVAPIGPPSEAVEYDEDKVERWLEGLREAEAQPEVGDVLWPQADILADTEPVTELLKPGEPFELRGVTLILDPEGLSGNPEYWLEDCNGDSVQDIVMQAGQLQMDFRTVLRRVRALDVTVLNRGRPPSGSLEVFNPAREQIAGRTIDVDENQGEVLSLRSDQPYHYAELAMADGCFLGFSLTPPAPDGEPAPPRPAVADLEGESPASQPTPIPVPTLASQLPTFVVGDVRTVAVGETVGDSIESDGEVDIYVIQAKAGDVVRVRMTEAAGEDFDPRIEVFDGQGEWLDGGWSYGDAVFDVMLESGGTYYILVGDEDGKDVGDYSVTVQRLNAPVGAQTVAFGQIVRASIERASEMDAYVFQAKAGDVVRVRVTEAAGGGFDPLIEVFDAQGKRLEGGWNYDDTVLDVSLEDSGTFLVLVSDEDGQDTGDYGVSLQRLSNPVGVKVIGLGETVNGSIDAPGEMDTYVFQARAGDVVRVRMSKIEGGLEPQIELFDAQGKRLDGGWNYDDAILDVSLESSGAFFLLLSDAAGDDTGTYSVSLQRQ